ncbi:MAG TPA: wax ester/triacylglycerol synthase family O-acyltransferase [Actinomycetota bacterium]|nr:wax ester/triacylglycerol synthase family O-acyltransferase [Actinomycetota bacterium]
MGTKRLTPADATFLHLEGPNTHMHVASVMVFDGAADYRQTLDSLQSRLHLVPRFRQKLACVPFNQGRPVWVDDPHFNLEYHVRHTALPAPGTEEQLKKLAGRLMSQQLDRSRPLWEIWLVDGLAGNRFAQIAKTHHCMIDGISGADITAVLLDATPEPHDAPAEPWTPQPEPTQAQLLSDAIIERLTEPAEIVRGLRATARTPRRLARSVSEALAGIGALAWAGMNPAPATPLNVPIGPHRRFEYVRASLADFKSIKNNLGGTVNDVVLTVVTGALRRFLQHRNIDVRGLELRAMVPVSVRADHEQGALGNRVSALVAPLPVYEPDPARRLQAVTNAMKGLKESRQVVGAEMITQLTGFAPPTILAQAARLQSAQRFFNLLVTNVPGPQFALFSTGRRLEDLFPMAPLAANQALGIAVMSYAGQMGFGLIADFDALPDVGVVAEGLEKSIAELLDAAEQAQAPAQDAAVPGNGSNGSASNGSGAAQSTEGYQRSIDRA